VVVLRSDRTAPQLNLRRVGIRSEFYDLLSITRTKRCETADQRAPMARCSA
jgi:hypothetical protein